MINKKYNRIQLEHDNAYINHYGDQFDISEYYEGYVKCKLIHSVSDSVVFPDLIIISQENDKKFNWIQPLTFLVNLLIREEEKIYCGFFVDISSGNTLKIEFSNTDFIINFEDNSSLFKCKIFGPKNLEDFSTGMGEWINQVPYIYLYHHTLPEYKNLILSSSLLKLSKWNIQGTKELKNIGYFYLTALDKISTPEDLKQIAMSSDGYIFLLLDNYSPQLPISPKEKENLKNGILQLKVYRENTANRKSSIRFLVDSTIISSKHLWKHSPQNQPVFYELCMPYIFRIGGNPNKHFYFKNDRIERQENIKNFHYQVVGDATKFTDLEAPYDEENTENIFKIEKISDKENILEFWFSNANSDLFNHKKIDL